MVVAQAERDGLVPAPSVVYLPQVPLNVPLPVPQTAPLPGQAPSGVGRHRRQRSNGWSVSPAILLGRRTRAMRLVLVVVFAALVVRLVGVQEFGHQHYASLSTSELAQTVTVPAVRGAIYDRNGEVLAESVTKQTVVADPLLITHPATIADALSPVLGIPVGQLRSDLTEPSGFVYLAHRVPNAVAAKVTALDLAGINLVPESQRVQPDGQLALPVVGSTGWNGTGRIRARVPVPVACWPASPVRRTCWSHPSGVALPGSGNDSVAAQPGTGVELTHRRIGPVRGRAGPGRRDRRLPRLQRHRRGRGREDR